MAVTEPIVLLDEHRWIRAAQDGDLAAFNQIVERYQSLAYNVAYRSLGHPEDAADATQDAFISAYRAIQSYRGGSFKGWLLRIVVNACHDLRRRAQRRPSTSMDALVDELGEAPWPDDGAIDPQQAALSSEERAQLERAIATLGEEQRLTLLLVDAQGLSYEEAAEAMQCPIGTVRSRLARARAHLRDTLLQDGNLL